MQMDGPESMIRNKNFVGEIVLDTLTALPDRLLLTIQRIRSVEVDAGLLMDRLAPPISIRWRLS